MSTTSDKEVAFGYATKAGTQHSLLFKLTLIKMKQTQTLLWLLKLLQRVLLNKQTLMLLQQKLLLVVLQSMLKTQLC